MNVDDLKRQAEAQGGRLLNASKAPWRSSNGEVMTEVLASVMVKERNGFAALRQWARKKGAVERNVFDIDTDVERAVAAVTPRMPKEFRDEIAQQVAAGLDSKMKYAILFGWLED